MTPQPDDTRTRVVHVNSPEFRDNPEAVYIGRGCNRSKDIRCRTSSIWMNPIKFSRVWNHTRECAISGFERLMYERLGLVPVLNPPVLPAEWRRRLLALDGKVLGCWCHPKPCHGDVLVKLIAELKEQRNA